MFNWLYYIQIALHLFISLVKTKDWKYTKSNLIALYQLFINRCKIIYFEKHINVKSQLNANRIIRAEIDFVFTKNNQLYFMELKHVTRSNHEHQKRFSTGIKKQYLNMNSINQISKHHEIFKNTKAKLILMFIGDLNENYMTDIKEELQQNNNTNISNVTICNNKLSFEKANNTLSLRYRRKHIVLSLHLMGLFVTFMFHDFVIKCLNYILGDYVVHVDQTIYKEFDDRMKISDNVTEKKRWGKIKIKIQLFNGNYYREKYNFIKYPPKDVGSMLYCYENKYIWCGKNQINKNTFSTLCSDIYRNYLVSKKPISLSIVLQRILKTICGKCTIGNGCSSELFRFDLHNYYFKIDIWGSKCHTNTTKKNIFYKLYIYIKLYVNTIAFLIYIKYF